MKRPPYALIAAALLAFAPSALADVSGNILLQTGTALNFDTGSVGSSGGDVLWTGTTIAPQGNARAYALANLGLFYCANLPQSYFESFTAAASSASIPNSGLVPGDAFMVVTNSGHVARACVASNSGGAIALLFNTFGVSAAPGVPVVTDILNNSSFVPFGQTNYGIAPSSIFVVRGSNLADPGAPVLQSSLDPGIPLTLNGASVTVVVNGVTVHPALYYTSPGQLAAVLPAATPVGSGALTVTYRGKTSAPALIQVVPSALGINTYGVSTGVVTDALTGALITTTNSASPGQILTLWTTGLGADPSDSDTTFSTMPHAVDTPLQIYIGGVLATIRYQGSAGYPGVDQINLTVPQGVPTGCWVPIMGVTGSIVSNVVTLAIDSKGGPCVDVVTGLNGGQVTPIDPQPLRTGLVDLVHTPAIAAELPESNSANAAFETYTGTYHPGPFLSPGGCSVGPVVSQGPSSVTGLDAGTITLTGPNGLSVTLGSQFGIKGAFTADLGADGIPTTGGTFVFKGSGGMDVGAFTATVTLSNPLLKVTSPSGSGEVDRTQGMLVSWTGGNPGTYLYITGVSNALPLGIAAGFTCIVPVDAKQFTVPASILLGLPAGSGGVNVENSFFMPLVASGLDVGLAGAAIADSTTSNTFK